MRSTFVYVRHEARERGDVSRERERGMPMNEMRLMMLHCFTYAQLHSIVPIVLANCLGSPATRHLYRFH